MKVLKFSTPTCKYCKITNPIVTKWAESVGYEVEDVNAEVDERAGKYELMSVPAIVILDGEGNAQQTIVGAENIMKFTHE